MVTRIKTFFGRPSTRAVTLFTGLYALCVLFIFWGTWGLDRAPVEPDQTVVYPIDFVRKLFDEIFAGGAFVPGDLRFILGGPYFWQELQYALGCFLGGFGVAFYLRGKRVRPLACAGAALAYSLMGYSFTLYSAGHLGWFVWLTYGPFAFGLIDRAVRKNKMRNWVLLGGVLAWAAVRQSDLWLLFTALSFLYGCWRLFQVVRAPGGVRRLLPLVGGIALCGAVVLAAGFPQFHRALVSDLEGRDAQIKATSSGAAKDSAEEDRQRWIFVTNWSLPPEDALEFVAGGVRGDSSDARVSPKRPYWGRLGRMIDEKFIPGRAAPNFRQHALYLGAVTVAFALLGLCLWPEQRKKDPARPDPEIDRSDIPFWTFAAAFLFICALGRFTPFYRLIYNLPFGNYLRAPVKFFHLFEFCTAVLAGFGLDAVLRAEAADRKRLRAAVYIVGLLAAVVLLCGLMTDKTALAASIGKLGYTAALASVSADNFVFACLRGFFLLAGACGVILLAVRGVGMKFIAGAVLTLILFNSIDMTEINRRYLAVEDFAFHRLPNEVAADIVARGGGKVFVAMKPQEGGRVLRDSLSLHLAETTDNVAAPDTRFILASGLTLRDDSDVNKRLRDGTLKSVGMYTVSAKKGIRRSTGSSANLMLIEAVGVSAPPSPAKPAPNRTAQFFTLLSVLTTIAVCLTAVRCVKMPRKG